MVHTAIFSHLDGKVDSKVDINPDPTQATEVAIPVATTEFDPLILASAHTAMTLQACSQWLRKFERDPHAENIEGVPVVTEDDVRALLSKIQSLHDEIASEPNNCVKLQELTDALEWIGRTDQALALRQRITGIDPESIQHHLDLVAHLQRLGRNEDALAVAHLASSNEPRNAKVHLALASCYGALHRDDLELSSLRHATVCEPESALAWRCLAQCLAGHDQLHASIDAWSKCIAANSNDSSAYVQRGAIKSTLGDRNGAIEDIREAVRLDPENTVNQATLASLLLAKRESVFNRIGAWLRSWF